MTFKKVQADKTFDLEFQWLDDGETILIPGKNHLVFIQKDEDNDNEWNIIEEERINHTQEISYVKSISNEILMTYSCSDMIIKIWKLDDEGCECLNEFKLNKKA